MPFVTEAIWQYLPHQGEALIVAPWPQPGGQDADAVERIEELMEVVRAIRNARSEYEVDPARRIAAVIAAGQQEPFLAGQASVLAALARVDETQLQIVATLETPPERALALVTAGYDVYLPLAALVDLERERERLAKELENVQQEIQRAEGLLANEGFVSRAPAEVVQRERDKLAAQQERRAKLEERLAALG
jgi:valyl-tRNA synthetase